MISVVLAEHKINNLWKKEYNFYSVDLTDVEFDNDWRFRAVDEKRKLSILLGTVDELSFPVKYPIVLNNSTLIEKI